MRAQTQESLARRIDRVLAHLVGALDQPLSLDALAEVACLSRFHFHRCYSALLGETPAGTLRRLRLTRAAGELVNGRRPLREIAARAGYGSLPAFVRAFAAAYGQPPGCFRAAALPRGQRAQAGRPALRGSHAAGAGGNPGLRQPFSAVRPAWPAPPFPSTAVE